ncbi:hypothetical protein E4656_05910 [Natronospirillum operosum]|uniref:Uncharacterized protein n=1 Tax=Natronospirillum operosum TaxID=2759953 RepID=A0A4Z0WKG1_9GAMM|nr:hypothetical protein [Natronospirillum operosum]TGG95931.1 hypothetical protein E4656_05910 [Natronospirillum operosum]
MQRKSRTLLATMGRYLSRSADGPACGLIVLALFRWYPPFDSLWLGAVASAFAIERLLYFVAKNRFCRHRPPLPVSAPS